MNKNIITKLRELKPMLKEEYGLEEFALFGSQARGDYTKNSDVDIAIIKIDKKEFAKRLLIKEFLEKHLNKRVDIGYFDSMKTFIQNQIKQEMKYV